MSPAVIDVVATFRRALEARFGARLRELVVFGSQARGTATEESDVDLLVVIDELAESERREVFDLAYDADRAAPQWVGLAPLAYSTEQAADLRSRERLLLRDIAREGIAV